MTNSPLKTYLPQILSFSIVFLAFLFRLYDLELRPFHHDEAVNEYFLRRITELGFYPYSHENYHGPLYFYVTYFFYWLIGDSEFGIRFSAVLFGTGVLVLPLMVRKLMGWRFVILLQLLLGSSASIIYYNRYAIHESIFLFFTIFLALAIIRYAEERKTLDLNLILLAMAGLVCIKETFIIVFLTFGIGALFLLLRKGGWPSLSQLKIPIGLFLFVIVFCYTGGFQWSKGLRELAMSVPQWLGRNESDVGHFKPTFYYFNILWGSSFLEFFKITAIWRQVNLAVDLGSSLVLYLLPINIFWMIRRKELPNYLVYGFIWLILVAAIYTFPVKYKTPWLVVNLSYPLYFFLAWQFDHLFRVINDRSVKYLLGVVVLIVLGVNLYSAVYYNFKYPYQQDKNPLAYVHTFPEVRTFASELTKLTERYPDKKIFLDLKVSWPLPYYLRKILPFVIYFPNLKDLDDCSSLPMKYSLIVRDATMEFNCPYAESRSFSLADNIHVVAYYTESRIIRGK